jgi:TolB-like protein/DNA-binding winged helix-turn-helix (wHTH) protein
MSEVLIFPGFELRLHERQLVSSNGAVALGARAFDLLAVLAQQAGQLVSKSDLMDAVWPGLVVEENNLQVHISTLRKLLGAQLIATVPGRGYRFTGHVSAPTAITTTAPAAASAPATALSPEPVGLALNPTKPATTTQADLSSALAFTPPLLAPFASPGAVGATAGTDSYSRTSRSLAVLPFVNLNDDPEQEYFSDGLAEDIIFKLTRSRWLFVIARNSSFAMRKATGTSAQVCQELDCKYLVTGTVRRSGNTLRVSAELTDGPLNQSLWAQRFDVPLDDLFKVQDSITSSIVSAIEPVYLRQQEQITVQASTPDMAYWDYLMRARWHFWRASRKHIEAAQQLLVKALVVQPNDPPALALFAFTYMSRVWAGWAENPKEEITEANRLALRAIRSDDTDAFAHFTLGTALSFTGNLGQAIAELEHSLTLYPQFAAAAGELGRLLAFAGRTEEAAEYVLQAMDASPQDPHLSLWVRSRAIACFVDEQYPQALAFAQQATAKRANWFFNYYLLAACYAANGDLESAARAVEQAKPFGPYTLQALRFGHPFVDPADLQRFVGYLEQAGWVNTP